MYIFTNMTPLTISINPTMACQLNAWVKKKYDNMATENTPKALHVEYTIPKGMLLSVNVKSQRERTYKRIMIMVLGIFVN